MASLYRFRAASRLNLFPFLLLFLLFSLIRSVAKSRIGSGVNEEDEEDEEDEGDSDDDDDDDDDGGGGGG